MKLADAIRTNDADAVRAALKRIKRINRASDALEGYTPLQFAAKRGADHAIEPILEAGADPRPDDSLHPVGLAATDGGPAVLASLLEAREWPTEVLGQAASDAGFHGKDDALRLLLERLATDQLPRKTLHQACRTGHAACIRLLLDHGVDPSATADVYRDNQARSLTPLHVAGKCGQAQAARLLLERGVAIDPRDALGRTPLMLAALEYRNTVGWREHQEATRRGLADPDSGVKLLSGSLPELPEALVCVNLLLEHGADPLARDEDGHDALSLHMLDARSHSSTNSGKRDLVARLKQAGATLDEPFFGLIAAVRDKNADACRDRIGEGADPNRRARLGDCLLGNAARGRSLEVVRALLDGGADPNRAGRNESPLFAAVVSGELEIVRAMLDAGADPNRSEPRPSDSGQDEAPPETPLTFAVSMRKHEIAALLREHGAVKPDANRKPRVEPGVPWWDDWAVIAVRADPEHVARTLAEALDGTTTDDALGQTVTPGRQSFLVVRPHGLAWTNLIGVTPSGFGASGFDGVEPLARLIAERGRAQTLYAAYNDTAAACEHRRFGPDGQPAPGDRDRLAELAAKVEWSAELGEEPDEADLQALADAGFDPDRPPHSTEMLEHIAREERFALAWAWFNGDAGQPLEVDFNGYASEAFEAVYFVTTA
ncbi:MAG: ankyrin repeat domain-containing protein [Planctomycetota bacterium]